MIVGLVFGFGFSNYSFMRSLLLLAVLLSVVGCAATPKAVETLELRCIRTSFVQENSEVSRITFIRNGTRDVLPIVVTLKSRPTADASFYTPRGPLDEVVIAEGMDVVTLSAAAIQAHPVLRTVEDTWPENCRLFSSKIGSYKLWIPYGVPAGISGVMLHFQKGKFLSAAESTDPQYVKAAGSR